MEHYNQDVRRLMAHERIEQLARDYGEAPRDRRRRGRVQLRELLHIGAYRRARNAQPARG